MSPTRWARCWGQVAQRVHLVASRCAAPTGCLAPPGRRALQRRSPQPGAQPGRCAGLGEERATAGANAPTVAFGDNAVTNDIDGHLFFEARITATATGAPVTKRSVQP